MEDLLGKEMSIAEEKMMEKAMEEISSMIDEAADNNISIYDVKEEMKNRGIVHIGIGVGWGTQKGKNAADDLLSGDFLMRTLDGARSVMLSVIGDISLKDLSDAVEMVSANFDKGVDVTFGYTYNDKIPDQCVVVAVIV